MAKKKITAIVKLQCPAGKATLNDKFEALAHQAIIESR